MIRRAAWWALRRLAHWTFRHLPLSLQLGIFVRYAADNGWEIKRVTLPMPALRPTKRIAA